MGSKFTVRGMQRGISGKYFVYSKVSSGGQCACCYTNKNHAARVLYVILALIITVTCKSREGIGEGGYSPSGYSRSRDTLTEQSVMKNSNKTVTTCNTIMNLYSYLV